MFDLYFAGQVTDHVDKCLFDMGANHLFSFLNEFYFFLFWKANKTFIYNERVIFYYHYSLRLFIALKI